MRIRNDKNKYTLQCRKKICNISSLSIYQGLSSDYYFQAKHQTEKKKDHYYDLSLESCLENCFEKYVVEVVYHN